MSPLRVALCGNPNVGKSTVFNALTGLRQHTGNWAGKTVESARGEVKDGDTVWELIDLPGAYSLLNGSPEETVASEYLAFEKLDAVIVVCDASSLERNLNLTLQMAQLYPRMVLCVNMMDEAKRHGLSVNRERLESVLGLPVACVSARKKHGLNELKRRVREMAENPTEKPSLPLLLSTEASKMVLELSASIECICPKMAAAGTQQLAALSALVSRTAFRERLFSLAAQPEALRHSIEKAEQSLQALGYTREKLVSAFISATYEKAEAVCREALTGAHRTDWQLRADRLIANRWVGIPLMLTLLALVLYITLLGANVPSAWLSERFAQWEPRVASFLLWLHFPAWLRDLCMNGVYRVTTWVIAVMLPPMAIFFPLFTLLEDSGLLPRVAFHLDRCFQCCHACGKQALCMCMGIGCNAVGVMGCRIIQSPRERLIAILTNAFIPCNGRYPTLILLISMFFVMGNGAVSTLLGAFYLVGFIVLSVLMTLGCSYLLSRTVLSGLPSAFSLELPPFRRPKVGEVLIRSVLDRTLFVLGRAVSVAAPAGAIVWCLANVQIQGNSILQWAAGGLNPLGYALGMDGAILLAFMLGFPANEIVLPLMVMIYLNQSTLSELAGTEALRLILTENGWTFATALCVTLFSMFHWPCSTTTLTIYRETRSLKWTALAVALPTLVGCALCAAVAFVFRLF